MIILLLLVPVISAGAADQGVNNLRGQWIFNWTLTDGSTPLPLQLLVTDVQSGAEPNQFLAAGCMRSPYSGAIMPLALQATYDPLLSTYDWTIFTTFVPSQQSGEMPYIIRFTGQAEMNGEGVSDDTASGDFMSNPYQGTWTGRHHDRRFFNCPPVDPEVIWLDMDVYAYADFSGREGTQVILEGRGIQVVSSAMRVTAPDGQVVDVPFYTDIFSPGTDFISEFRFLANYPGLPIPGLAYHFVLLDALGRPIPGTERQDIWTHCLGNAPTNLLVTPNPATGTDVLLTWSGVPIVSGEFQPPEFGFYQIGLGPMAGGNTSFGANGIAATQHVLPWAPFSPNSTGFPDGFDMGVSLSEFEDLPSLENDTYYGLAVFAFAVPPANSGGQGLECFTADWNHAWSMLKSGDTLTFGPFPPP